MDIYVFDKSFNLLGVIERYTSLIWKREFYNVGTFELHSFVNDAVHLLQKDNILMKSDSPNEAVYIDTITLDDDVSDTIVARGFFIENFLDDRFVWGTQSHTGIVESVMKGFVINNCISPTDPSRIIPNMVVSVENDTTPEVTEVYSNMNLAELMVELSIKYDVGWRILFDATNRQYVFDAYSGKDSSINQSVNPHVIFSAEYENVLTQTYTDSNSSYKNMVLVAGQEIEGFDRLFVPLNNNLTGFQRKELYIDASDITPEDVDGNSLTDAEYIILLEERGKSRLAELQPIQTFESGISILSNLIYKQDFDLGDIVTVQNNNWGLTINTRITTVEEVYEDGTRDIRVNFGSNIPTIIDKINRAVR